MFYWKRSGLGLCAGLAVAVVMGSSQARADWKQEWEKTLEQAKKEGEVVMYGGFNPIYREHTQLFEKKYPGIRVSYTPGGGSQHATRILSERRAGQYIVDLVMGGASTFQTYPEGTFEPLRPFLILPEVTDKSAWWGGDLSFVDAKEKYVLTTVGQTAWARPAYNTKLVDPGSIHAWRDFLSPRWKGKIARHHRPGSVSDTLLFLYHNPSLGLEFISRLYKETGLVHTTNPRQGLNWLAEGKFLIYLDGSARTIREANSNGLHVDVLPHSLKEGDIISGSYCCMGVLTRGPHLNAAKVFVNWYLSKEGQIALQKLAGYTSLRVDIPKDDLPAEMVPRKGTHYIHINQAKYHQPKDLDAVRKIIEGAQGEKR
jgi:ABC-type Fe3+ transport system substrate-binding protein